MKVTREIGEGRSPWMCEGLYLGAVQQAQPVPKEYTQYFPNSRATITARIILRKDYVLDPISFPITAAYKIEATEEEWAEFPEWLKKEINFWAGRKWTPNKVKSTS